MIPSEMKSHLGAVRAGSFKGAILCIGNCNDNPAVCFKLSLMMEVPVTCDRHVRMCVKGDFPNSLGQVECVTECNAFMRIKEITKQNRGHGSDVSW